MVYPQNAGLYQGLQDMRARNQRVAQRGTTPYQPSLGDPNISGAGAYAMGGLAGGMNNYAAQQNYGQTGYMPNRTVGGAYGLGGRDPLGQNRLNSQQVLGAATGNQYAPMNQTPLGMAPTNQAGYDQQMQAQNPNARFFGGLLPTNITSSGGTVRPGWMAPPQSPEMGGTQQSMAAADYAMRQRGYNQSGGAWQRNLSPGDAQYQAQQAATAMFDARRGGLAQRQQDYQSRTQADMQGRQAGVQMNAYNSAQARKARMGIGDPVDMAMRQNPGIAGLMGVQGMQNQQQMAQMGLQQQQFQSGLDQRNFDRGTGLLGSLQGMEDSGALTPELRQQLQQHAMGLLGIGQPGGAAMTPQAQTGLRSPILNPRTPKEHDNEIAARQKMLPELWKIASPDKIDAIMREKEQAKRDQMMNDLGISLPRQRKFLHDRSPGYAPPTAAPFAPPAPNYGPATPFTPHFAPHP